MRDLVVHSFFLLLNSIQLYEYNDCLFTTDRHLGCFWGLGIMNKAAMNVPLQGLCGQMLSFLLGKYPAMELLGHGVKKKNVRSNLCIFQIVLHSVQECLRILLAH